MARIIWTEPALSDLEEIAEYIALDKPSAAQKLVRSIFSKVERIKQFPHSGRKPPELPGKTRYREVVIKPCRIFYRVRDKQIIIVHIMRTEMMLRQYLLEENDS